MSEQQSTPVADDAHASAAQLQARAAQDLAIARAADADLLAELDGFNSPAAA